MDETSLAGFDGLERVVADDLRFKLRLGIGDEAYASIKLGKRLYKLWDVGGVAATGGAVAASAPVATTFFAGSGVLSALGLGAAAVTPVGWVAAAAVATGGAYYGVTRLLSSYSGSRVQVIPTFINTPIDELGMSLLDLMGTLAVKLAEIDGRFDAEERAAIRDYFVKDWGYDPAYVASALDLLAANSGKQSLREATAALARFKRSNPDCNYAAMHAELVGFLREVAEADGTLDEREEMAIEKVDAVLAEAGGLGQTVREAASLPGRALGLITGLVRRKGRPE
ncbi:TerB family tellurite resistance protein [Rubellimicrobium roseum]|uniref:Co-chaperone DjlA N-terminal domain-containing protein n=1 Tax=Rubellimicrobium roseum TaxID=687525 RepID=A0A5C4NLQ1_9RHOB|nr:TerB family tellurite resistance protein [Rubellimicrobium roseum]TNC74920.1 hypothetical protein FHG71_01980 [Rubellimicrobium roseum]